MPRKGEVPKRDTIPDPKYTDAPIDVRKRVTKFMNTVMNRGKKSTAEQIVYGALDLVEQRSKQEALKIFDLALQNVKPKLEVKSRRVGGSTYQVPVDVRPERSIALGMRWLVIYSRDRGEKTMVEKLAAEILDASQNRGNAVKKREDTHKMAEANKAFAHYRW
jgi:small subunit ribosomal protein S7